MGEEIKIGTEDCSVQKVMKVLKESESFSLFYENWRDFAEELQIDRVTIKELDDKRKFDQTYKIQHVVRDLLELWVSKEGSRATLDPLLKALHAVKLVALKDRLRETFVLPNKANVEIIQEVPASELKQKSNEKSQDDSNLAFVNNSLPFAQGCSKEGSLLIDCNIRRHGVAVPVEREQMQSFGFTRNANSFSAVNNIQLQKPKITVRFDRVGSSAAKNFRDKLLKDCYSNRNNLLPSMRNLFEGEKLASLTSEDAEWLKTDLLFVTAENGNVEALKYLIGKGFNFNIVDKDGRTPLHYTMYDGDKKIGLEKAKLLVDSGIADVHVLDNIKWSVLYYTARNGSSEAVEYFLQRGCDVNSKDVNGNTSLHYTVWNTNEEEGLKNAKSLIANGADLSIKNKSGENALDYATRYYKTKIAQLLRSHHQSSR